MDFEEIMVGVAGVMGFLLGAGIALFLGLFLGKKLRNLMNEKFKDNNKLKNRRK